MQFCFVVPVKILPFPSLGVVSVPLTSLCSIVVYCLHYILNSVRLDKEYSSYLAYIYFSIHSKLFGTIVSLHTAFTECSYFRLLIQTVCAFAVNLINTSIYYCATTYVYICNTSFQYKNEVAFSSLLHRIEVGSHRCWSRTGTGFKDARF